MTECRSCGAEILWAQTLADRHIPLDPEPLGAPAAGLVALNPATGRACVLSYDDLFAVERWQSGGVTLHRSHFATCPTAARHRVPAGQESLL